VIDLVKQKIVDKFPVKAEEAPVSVENATEPKPTAEKPEAKKERKAKKEVEPKEPFINKWGFLHFKQEILEAFGAPKGQKTFVTIEQKEGALVIRKA
jgi:hypothetical protein